MQLPISDFILTYILSRTVSKLLQRIYQVFSFGSRGYLSLTHSFRVNHYTYDYEIWP